MNPVRLSGFSALLLATMTFAGCNGEPTREIPFAGIRILSGNATADTIQTIIPPVVFEVRRIDGTPARDTEVRIELSPPVSSTGFVRRLWLCSAPVATCAVNGYFNSVIVDSTDGDGKFTVPVRFASVVGPAALRISAPTLGFVDSLTFTVRAGNPASVRATWSDTALTVGTSAVLGAQVLDRGSNVRTETATATVGTGTAITFNTATLQASAQQFGMQTVYFAFNTLRDSTIVRVVPPGRIVGNVAGTAMLFNTDGSGTRVLTTGLGDLTGQPRFDSSRQRVSHVTGDPAGFSTRMSIVDTSGTPRRDMDLGLNSIIVTRLLADGSLLAAAQRTPVAGFSVWRIGTDNSVTLVRAVPGLLSIAGSADISPDGTLIAYGVISAPTSTQQLRVMNLATGTIITGEQQMSQPRFTRQGDRIVFSAVDGTAIINTDLTGRRVLTPTALTNGPILSPDGLYLLGRLVNAPATASTHLIRLSDGATVPLRVRGPSGAVAGVIGPDWR